MAILFCWFLFSIYLCIFSIISLYPCLLSFLDLDRFLEGQLEIYTLSLSALVKVAKLYWEGCQHLFGRFPNFIWKVTKLYWEGCQTLWVNGHTYLQDILSESSVTSRYFLLINLLGRFPNFIGKVAKLYWEGCQHLFGRFPNFIWKVAKI